MDSALSEEQALKPGGSWRERVRTAWELSKPPDYGPIGESLSEMVSGRVAVLARIEEGVASVLFFGTFLTVLAEVLLRLFGHPVVWALELPTYLFIWAFCVAAGLSDWNDHHLAFDLVAEKLPHRVKWVIDLVLNLLFIGIFAAAIPGTISFLSFSATQPSSGLPFSQEWGYAGIFLLFVVAVLLRARLAWIQVAVPLRKVMVARREGGQ